MSIEDEITKIMKREGWDTFTDDPDDLGGPTKFGVTIPALSGYLGRRATALEIADLTEADARAVYREVVVKPFAAIKDRRLLAVVLDTATLHGETGAKKIVQRALGVDDDGIWGPITLAAIQDSSMLALAVRVLTARARTEADRVADKPVKLKYLRGWISRTMSQVEELLA